MQNEYPLNEQRKLSPLKIASYADIAVGAIVLICILVSIFSMGTIMNNFIKPRITKAFADAYPAYTIRIADMDYSILKNRFEFDSIALRAVDGTFSSKMGSFSVRGIKWIHLLWGGTLGPKDFVNVDLDAQAIELNLQQSLPSAM